MSASNSYRLGANEAPPAILSCFWVHNYRPLSTKLSAVGNEK